MQDSLQLRIPTKEDFQELEEVAKTFGYSPQEYIELHEGHNVYREVEIKEKQL